MKKMTIITLLIALLCACEETETSNPENVLKNRELTITSEVLSADYVGNGAQWGGYDVVPNWLESKTLSDADWDKMFARIDYMRPPFLRIITSPSWSYDNGGNFDTETKTASLYKMLGYAQSRNIEVVYGEWGHQYSDNASNINTTWIANSVKFLDYLVNTKGYTCIKTVNIVNEPNGDWSSTDGDYNLWKNIQELYVAEMQNYSLSSVKLCGPDVAIFNSTNEAQWIKNAANDLDEDIGLYDIHVYPEQTLVRNGEYTAMLQAYRDATPSDKRIVLGEIGFKYTEIDNVLRDENEEAILADPYASDDSNMKIYESFYGIDMADAIIQSMRAGFSGALVWSMDDAMYNHPGSDGGNNNTSKLKRWGFWNILGEELCNDATDEEIRPWFYTVSLLCRYFPAGCNIYNVEIPTKKGFRAIMAEKDGKYTIALVNSGYTSYQLILKSSAWNTLTLDKYLYKAEIEGKNFTGTTDENGYAIPVQENVVLDFSAGEEFTLDGQSFLLYTNME